jgi:hydroxylamine reductase
MYCNQCEQSYHGTGCVNSPGVCGKDEDVQLQETLLYGLKGMASYAHHARRLGKSDEEVSAFIEEALFATVTNVNFDIPSLLEMVLECGKQNLKVMEMLDAGHIEAFGQPGPGHRPRRHAGRPGILITGHDMLDLWDLLTQCEGTDIRVYTHGEMLPAHMYPKLREHPNLAGHYGGAWQKQKKEFAAFPGAVLATTNCVLIPTEAYKDRLFTTRATAVPGSVRLTTNDFSPVIECAKQCAPCIEHLGRESTVGFHRTVLLENAGGDRRGREGRQDQPLLRDRRLRRRRARPQLLQ